MSERWTVNSGRFKMVHRLTCRHAKPDSPYSWAGECTPRELAARLHESDAWMWHRGCLLCAPDLDAAILGYPSPFEESR